MATLDSFTIAELSPAGASTVAGTVIRGLKKYDFFTIDAAITGATGGVLDVYLQREVGGAQSGVWRDWCRFTQAAAGAAVAYYYLSSGVTTDITAVGTALVPVIAANTFLGGHPGDAVRALYVAGSSTSAGATQTIIITGWYTTK